MKDDRSSAGYPEPFMDRFAGYARLYVTTKAPSNDRSNARRIFPDIFCSVFVRLCPILQTILAYTSRP